MYDKQDKRHNFLDTRSTPVNCRKVRPQKEQSALTITPIPCCYSPTCCFAKLCKKSSDHSLCDEKGFFRTSQIRRRIVSNESALEQTGKQQVPFGVIKLENIPLPPVDAAESKMRKQGMVQETKEQNASTIPKKAEFCSQGKKTLCGYKSENLFLYPEIPQSTHKSCSGLSCLKPQNLASGTVVPEHIPVSSSVKSTVGDCSAVPTSICLPVTPLRKVPVHEGGSVSSSPSKGCLSLVNSPVLNIHSTPLRESAYGSALKTRCPILGESPITKPRAKDADIQQLSKSVRFVASSSKAPSSESGNPKFAPLAYVDSCLQTTDCNNDQSNAGNIEANEDGLLKLSFEHWLKQETKEKTMLELFASKIYDCSSADCSTSHCCTMKAQTEEKLSHHSIIAYDREEELEDGEIDSDSDFIVQEPHVLSLLEESMKLSASAHNSTLVADHSLNTADYKRLSDQEINHPDSEKFEKTILVSTGNEERIDEDPYLVMSVIPSSSVGEQASTGKDKQVYGSFILPEACAIEEKDYELKLSCEESNVNEITDQKRSVSGKDISFISQVGYGLKKYHENNELLRRSSKSSINSELLIPSDDMATGETSSEWTEIDNCKGIESLISTAEPLDFNSEVKSTAVDKVGQCSADEAKCYEISDRISMDDNDVIVLADTVCSTKEVLKKKIRKPTGELCHSTDDEKIRGISNEMYLDQQLVEQDATKSDTEANIAFMGEAVPANVEATSNDFQQQCYGLVVQDRKPLREIKVLDSNAASRKLLEGPSVNIDLKDIQLPPDPFHIQIKIVNDHVVSSEEHAKPKEVKREPFKSSDPQENQDIEHPDWDKIKKLSTDEERYKQVRSCWHSKTIPDPNHDLTFHSFRKKNSSNGKCSSYISRHKRQASENIDPRQAKRMRTKSVPCTEIIDLKIDSAWKKKEEAERNIRAQYHKEMRFLLKKQNKAEENFKYAQNRNQRGYDFAPFYDTYVDAMQTMSHVILQRQHERQQFSVKQKYGHELHSLETCYSAEIGMLEEVRREVNKFCNFYKGLFDDESDPTVLTEAQLEELNEIDNMYHQFEIHYDDPND